MTKIPEQPTNPLPNREHESRIPKRVDSEKTDKKFKPPVDKKQKDKNMDIDKDANIHPNRPKPFTPDSKHPHKHIGPYNPKYPHIGPNDNRSNGKDTQEKKEKPEKKDEDEKKKTINKPEGIAVQTPGIEIKSQTAEVKETKSAEITPADAAKAVSQIREVVLRMVSTLRTGTIGDMPVHQMDLKTTNDVPVFLRGASVMITKEAPGKISVSISNLSASNADMAIKAIEDQSAQLQQLMKDLAQRQLAITDLRVGEHSIALPRLEALPPTPFAAASEGFNDRRRDEGGGGEGRGGGKNQGDQEKGDREER